MTELAKAIILMGCAIGSGIAMISGFGPGIGEGHLPLRCQGPVAGGQAGSLAAQGGIGPGPQA